jgi:hypothetical protein
VDEFRHSMELSKGGDAYDWFFLAMIDRKEGRAAEGRTWFDKAIAWTKRNAPKESTLRRYWSEAAELLGLPGPDAAGSQAAAAPKPASNR